MQHPPKTKPKKRASKRLALIAVGALAALAAALVLLLPVVKRAFPAARYAQPQLELRFRTLAEYDATALETVTISHIAGDSYTLRQQDGALWLQKDGGLTAISETCSDEILAAATTLAVEDTVTEDQREVADHLADMGLEPPQTTVTARYADGIEIVMELGCGVPETTYSYYRWSGGDGVYMCGTGTAEAFALTEARLLPVEQPTLDKALIDHASLRAKGGERIEMAFQTDAAGETLGWLQSPVAYAMGADATDAVLTALVNLRLGVPVGEATHENRAEYGFDDPLLVIEVHRQAGAHAIVSDDGQLTAEMLDEKTFRLTLGRAEGDFFYTCLYEGHCYYVSRFLCESLLSADADGLVTRNPADLGGADVSAVTVATGGGTLNARAAWTERVLANNELETDEDGNVLYDITVTINGESATAEQMQALVERLKALTVSGKLDAGWSPDGKTPRWRMTVTTRGGATREIAAYALDAFSDALVVDGEALHYAYVEALQTALAEWTP